MTETFGQEVRRRREALRLAQSDLARWAGLSRNTIGNIERGRGQTEDRVVQCLREALDMAESGDQPAHSRLSPRSDDPVRETIARTLDALVDALADDLIPPDSATAEAAAFRAARRAYQHAARIARGDAR